MRSPDGEALLCPAVKPGLAGLGLSRDVAGTFQAETWPGGETWHSLLFQERCAVGSELVAMASRN